MTDERREAAIEAAAIERANKAPYPEGQTAYRAFLDGAAYDAALGEEREGHSDPRDDPRLRDLTPPPERDPGIVEQSLSPRALRHARRWVDKQPPVEQPETGEDERVPTERELAEQHWSEQEDRRDAALEAHRATTLGGEAERDDELNELLAVPRDLAAILRDPAVVIHRDAAVFDLIGRWQKVRASTEGVDFEELARTALSEHPEQSVEPDEKKSNTTTSVEHPETGERPEIGSRWLHHGNEAWTVLGYDEKVRVRIQRDDAPPLHVWLDYLYENFTPEASKPASHEHFFHPGEDQCRCGLTRQETATEPLQGDRN